MAPSFISMVPLCFYVIFTFLFDKLSQIIKTISKYLNPQDPLPLSPIIPRFYNPTDNLHKLFPIGYDQPIYYPQPLHTHTYQGQSSTMEIVDIGNTVLSHLIHILPCPMTELGATGVICTHPGPDQDSNMPSSPHLLFKHPLILSAAPPSHPASLRTEDKGQMTGQVINQVTSQVIDQVIDHVINYVIKSCT